MANASATRASAPAALGCGSWVRRHGLDVALALPLFACVLLFTVASVLDTVRLSLTAAFCGLPSIASCRAILATEVFRTATLNTVVVALLSLALQLGVGLGVALDLHARFPLRGLVRTVMPARRDAAGRRAVRLRRGATGQEVGGERRGGAPERELAMHGARRI